MSPFFPTKSQASDSIHTTFALRYLTFILADVSETEFRVSIVLDVTNDDGDDSESRMHPKICYYIFTSEEDVNTTKATIILNVQYPPLYPDEAPRLDISTPPNASKHPYLDIQEDKSTLLSSLDETITENLGIAMIFTLVSTLKDSAELLISERQASKQALKEIEAQKAEEEENRKFHGTAVTRESFLKWREKFRQEMKEEAERREQEREDEMKRKKVKEERRPTGKELWQSGVAKGEEDEGDGMEEAVEKLKIDAVA